VAKGALHLAATATIKVEVAGLKGGRATTAHSG